MLLLFSCDQHANEKDNETTTKGNISTTVSTDTAKLSKLLDLRTYKPIRAKFKYVFIDNSRQNKRLAVPAPSDSYLQALLYFDASTFEQLRTNYFNADYPSPNYLPQEFNFDWLDTDLKKELLHGDSSYHGHPDLFLGTGIKGKLWLLENKLLLVKSTS
jgi:hypothetical protein